MVSSVMPLLTGSCRFPFVAIQVQGLHQSCVDDVRDRDGRIDQHVPTRPKRSWQGAAGVWWLVWVSSAKAVLAKPDLTPRIMSSFGVDSLSSWPNKSRSGRTFPTTHRLLLATWI